MKVIFSHGKESGPWGTKIRRLAEIAKGRGVSVESLDYTHTMDPDNRVEQLLETLSTETEDFLLAGSSMGGYVALVASQQVIARGVFLMAPALYIPGYACQDYASISPHVEIIHGWNDDIIPVENSIRYARDAGCLLNIVNGNHALDDVLDLVDQQFSGFLDRTL